MCGCTTTSLITDIDNGSEPAKVPGGDFRRRRRVEVDTKVWSLKERLFVYGVTVALDYVCQYLGTGNPAKSRVLI